MAVEIFSRAEFEKALPCDKRSGAPLWSALGVVEGEQSYILSVGALAAIEVRSSVDASGYSRGCGQDSIRAWLVDYEGKPLGSKIQKYVTRVVGWQDRMINVLRELAKRAKKIKECPKCANVMGVYKVKKDGPNKGRLFMKCRNNACKSFEWVD